MKDPFGLSRAVIPASYSQLLLEVLQSRGLGMGEVVQHGRLPAKLALASDTRLTIRQWSRIILSALELSQDPGLGCEYGLRMRVTVHGVMGYALLSAPTLGGALALIAQFFAMRVRSYGVHLTVEAGQAVLTLIQHQPVVGLPEQQALMLRRFVDESLLLSILTGCRYLLGRDLLDPELRVEWPRPDYYERYRHRLPAMRFGQAATQLRFCSSELAEPLLTADAIAYGQALQQCEHEWLRFVDEAVDIVTRIKAALVLKPGAGYPALSEVAGALQFSERTLKRRLQEQGTSFRDLLNEVRQADAVHLLTTTDRSVQDISDWLGYATPTNFVRAFRLRWDKTPNQYREETAAIDDPGT